MKPLFLLLCAAALLQGCASLTALEEGSAEERPPKRLNSAGDTLRVRSGSYPAVAVTPDGEHAVIMPPNGNLAVVVNPDGSHATAIINGSTATIVTH